MKKTVQEDFHPLLHCCVQVIIQHLFLLLPTLKCILLTTLKSYWLIVLTGDTCGGRHRGSPSLLHFQSVVPPATADSSC